MNETIQKSVLHSTHEELGGKMVPFAGWEMPVQYSSIMQEHSAVREKCGIFDISHMGEVFITGPAAGEKLNALLTNDVSKLSVGKGQYTLMLNEQGGVIDDLILYRSGDQSYFAVINAACIDRDVSHMQQHLSGEGVEFRDESAAWSAMAIQGPLAADIFAQVLPDAELPPRNGFVQIDDLMICRTGYTGEDGFEFFCSHETATEWFKKFIAAGAEPCGLGCRDSLRLEVGFPLNGSDLSEDISPLEAGLGVFVSLESADFIGKNVLLRQKANGLKQKLVGIQYTGKGAPPRAHYSVENLNGKRIGELTSGVFSPSIKSGIAMAYLPIEYSQIGTDVCIEVRGNTFPAKVVKKPFYRKD